MTTVEAIGDCKGIVETVMIFAMDKGTVVVALLLRYCKELWRPRQRILREAFHITSVSRRCPGLAREHHSPLLFYMQL